MRIPTVSAKAQKLLTALAVVAAIAAATLTLWPIRTVAGEGNAIRATYYQLSFICRGYESFYDEVCGDRSIAAISERRRQGAAGLALLAVGAVTVTASSRRKQPLG